MKLEGGHASALEILPPLLQREKKPLQVSA